MAINIEDLPLKYQEQAARKEIKRRQSTAIKQLEAWLDAAADAKKKTQKYHAEQTEWNKIKFDSRAEQRRYQQLMRLLDAGEIAELKVHPEFTLIEAYTKPDGKRVRRMRYTADFSYQQGGALVVEDVKSRPTRTTDYQMRKKLMLDKYGIEIREVT